MESPSDLTARLEVAIQAAHAAGKILREGVHSGDITHDTKSNGRFHGSILSHVEEGPDGER